MESLRIIIALIVDITLLQNYDYKHRELLHLRKLRLYTEIILNYSRYGKVFLLGGLYEQRLLYAYSHLYQNTCIEPIKSHPRVIRWQVPQAKREECPWIPQTIPHLVTPGW